MTTITTTALAQTDTDLRNASLPATSPADAAGIADAGSPPAPKALPPQALTSIAVELAAQVDTWQPLLRVDPERRWYQRLLTGDGWEAWLLTWLPGQGTDLHDHGGSAGAFTVLAGELEELTPARNGDGPARLHPRVLRAGQVRAFGPSHIHQVTGVSADAAASLHVYGPALTVMNRYRLDPERGPVVAVTERAGQDW